MNRYQRLEKIAAGAYGIVYKARDKQTDTIVAMKRIKLELEDEGIPSTALREISILKEIKHPNIVRFQDCILAQRTLYLVFEYVELDLHKYMKNSLGKMEGSLVQSFMFQCLTGLEYCHSKGVLHRDMKPQNILVNANGELKIADFGLARTFCPPLRALTHEVVTLWYRAPEILLGEEKYAPAVDVWSCGVIFIEMITKHTLFPGDSEIDELYKIFRLLGTPNEETWPGVTSLPDWNPSFPQWPKLKMKKCAPDLRETELALVEQMLVSNPRDRISARRALAHEYFNTLNDQKDQPPNENQA